MPTGTRSDPYRGCNFLVEIEGITQAGFQECSGLEISTDTVEYREGNDPNHGRKLPGMNKYAPLTLKRGITDSTELWKWRETVTQGKAVRKNITVTLLNDAGERKLAWDCLGAWPSKWTGPSFNAGGNAIAIETLELSHEELKMAG